MSIAEVVFMGFILFSSGVRGQIKTICAFEGSSVDLTCSNPNSATKWYILNKNGSHVVVQEELSANGHRVVCNFSEEGQTTLTINDLRETDANVYCCTDKPDLCKQNGIRLSISDLQVKVIPNTEDESVTLLCSTSCALTESYIWYKNGRFEYEDSCPWYQELVSSEEGVTYSCAIKGHEDLRAPDVSVDSITPTCFTVTYAKGKMCSYHQKSENEPCSITYPRELLVQSTSPVTLTCNTSCPMTDHQTNFSWYQDRRLQTNSEKQQFSVSGSSNGSFSCAVKGLEHLLSPEVCTEDKNCSTVNYQTRRICALEGSEVDISSDYSYSYDEKLYSNGWFIKRRVGEKAEMLPKVPGRVDYHDNIKNQHILRIHNLKRQDSGELIFSLQKDLNGWESSSLPGVTLVVTGLRVRFTPSAVVKAGQRVTLTCSTSCPLSGNTSYIWSFKNQPLPESRNKRVVLDPVDSQDAGSYFCAVKIGAKTTSSDEKSLTVLIITKEQTLPAGAAAGFGAALLVLIILNVSCWMIKRRICTRAPQSETSENTEQLNSVPMNENISAPSDQDSHHYNRLLFSKNQTEDVYSTIKPESSD
ncbi:hypothetical protein Q8A73_003018 [Channa argus]|nr:hypothetical protein Q8A73_003018 [Channa argus]